MARAATQTSRAGRTAGRGAKSTSAAAGKAAAPAAKPKRGAPRGTKRTTEVDGVIGAKIRMRRGELGMNQTDLGKAIGVTFQQVQKYENGSNRVGGSRLAGIAKALDVPVSYFFDQTGEELEAVQGSLLNTRGAVSLLKAYASIKDRHQRQAMINLARAMVGQEPLEDEDAVH
jgi:transcriptional regulator with XRE-family HTH domain